MILKHKYAKLLQVTRPTAVAGNCRNQTLPDLRYTCASWHVQSGTPLFVLKELGGWETLEMVKKYAHLTTDHLAERVNNVTPGSQQEAQKKRAA